MSQSWDNMIYVTKASGEKVPYDPAKIKETLKISGLGEEKIDQYSKIIERQLYDGISTRKIFDLSYNLLKKSKSIKAAGRYKLKQAIFDLGPSGYPFEIFVGKLFESFGFRVKVGEMLEGKCISHEVDVVATRDKTLTIVETKFRVDYRGKTTVQVPLYINSRFNDLKGKLENEDRYKDFEINGYVVTNARFTADAIKYADCVGLGLISWDYPSTGSLKHFIDRSGLHPLTSLHSLRKHEKKALLENGIVLCNELNTHEDTLSEIGLTPLRIRKVLDEAEMLTRI
jgi:hypothetical protein